jgi:hypothetical protein
VNEDEEKGMQMPILIDAESKGQKNKKKKNFLARFCCEGCTPSTVASRIP